MVYEKAKQIISTETSKEGIVLDEKAKLEVAKTKKNLNAYKKITESYIDKLTYEEKGQDKSNYIRELWTALKDVLKDKKGTKEEMEKFRKDLNGKSESLKERIVSRQKAHEALKFKAVKELNSENMLKADFDGSIKRLEDFKKSLSPLNKTDNSGNIEERGLRLDMKAQEQIDSLKNLKKLYEAKYSEGTVFVNGKENFYVHSSKNGIVEFSPYEFDEKKKDAKPKMKKRQKMNWIKFKHMTEKAGCKVRKLEANKYKDFDVDADKEVIESRAKIEETKRLKEINYIFSGKILDSIKDPKQKELMKQGIEEHYNSMRLYFEKDANGVVRPTEVYQSLNVQNRVKALIKMLSGINSIIEKIKLKETLENEKDPIKKAFYKAEMAFKNGDHMQAYAHFKAFKKQTDLWGYRNYQAQFSKLAKEWDLPGAIKIAEARLRQLSFKLINTAEKYVVSAIQQKSSGVFISAEVAKKTYKELSQVLNGMRKALQSGEAYDVGTAWQKVGMPWLRAQQDRTKGLKFGDLGRSETQLRIFHMPMILKLADIAVIKNKEEQKKKLLTLADDARKTKFRGSASILYKEFMQDDLQKYEKDKMKTKDYWKEKRKTYLAIKNSNNPIVKSFRDEAKEIAMKRMGKEKFEKLDEADRKALVERYEHMLIENEVDKGATKSLFKGFLKNAQGNNKAAAKYIDMEDPFDEWFKLSDAGADTVKEIAGEAVVLACSGGLGNLAGRGVTAGLRTLAKKSAEKLAVRLATAGAGIAVDMVVSEIIDRGIRTVLMGQKGLFSKKELMNALKHSVATYGVLSLGGRVSGVAMRRLENAGQLTKYAARVGQVVGVEAPLMATLNQQFAGEGSWLDHYGQSMMSILASRAGMKLLHGATDNMLLKAEHAMEFKARLHSLKAKDPAKGALIDGMLKSGEIPREGVMQLMDSNLSVTDMKKLSKYMDDPKNAGFLLAIKYAEEHGTMTKKMQEQYQEHLLDLRMMGFSKSQAAKFSKSLSLQSLVTKYGEGAKKIAKDQLDSAVSALRKSEAKEWLKTNTGKVKEWLKNPNIKEAFVTFMEKTQGNYAKFLEKYPTLAKVMPKDLTNLRLIPVPVIAASCGVAFQLKSVKELWLGDIKLHIKPGDNIKIKAGENDYRTLKIGAIDSKNGIVTVYDWKLNKNTQWTIGEFQRALKRRINEETPNNPQKTKERGEKVGQVVLENGQVLKTNKASGTIGEGTIKKAAERNKRNAEAKRRMGEKFKEDNDNLDINKLNNLASRLKKIGLDNYADSVAKTDSKFSGIDGTDIGTLEKRVKFVEKLEKLHAKIDDELDYLEMCGYGKELNAISNYSNGKYVTLEERLQAAEKMTQDVENFKVEYKIASGDLARGTEMVNFRSPEGQQLKKLLDQQREAKMKHDSKKAPSLYNEIQALVKPVFGEGDAGNKKLMTLMEAEDVKAGVGKFTVEEYAGYIKTQGEEVLLDNLRERFKNGIDFTHPKLADFVKDLPEFNQAKFQGLEKLKLFIGIKKQIGLLKTSPMDADQKAIQIKRLNECLQMLKDGRFGSDMHHGTNSSILKQLTPGNPELLSGLELQRRGIVAKSGEKDLAGGSAANDVIFAGWGRDGLGTARAYAELNQYSEGYLDPARLNRHHLEDRIQDFNRAIALMENASPESLDIVRMRTRMNLKTLKRLRSEYQAALNEKLHSSENKSADSYQIIFGMKQGSHEVEYVRDKSTYKKALSGEVAIYSDSVSLKNNLEVVYVPEANIKDARQNLVRLLGAEKAKQVKVYSIESLDMMGGFLGKDNPYKTTYSKTYEALSQNLDVSLNIINRELQY